MTKGEIPSPEKQRVVSARLGIKFNRLFWPVDRLAVIEILEKLNYKDIENTNNQLIEASKSNVDFYWDYNRIILGFRTRKFDAAITAQKEFFSVVKRDFRTNLADFIKFYEAEYVSDYFTEKEAHGAFSSLYSDSSSLSEFENIIGLPIRAAGINLVSREGETDDSKWYSIDIEPKIESANNTYFCRIVYRNNSPETVYSIARKCPEIVDKIVSNLERK